MSSKKNTKPHDDRIRLVVLGSGGVGKSALTVKFVQNIFVEQYSPTVEDSYRVTRLISGRLRMFEITDTAGTEQFTAMRDLYMKTGDGFVLVYSITSMAGFADLAQIYEQLIRVKDSTDIPIILCGNKCDLENDRIVDKEYAEAKAREWNCMFCEVSAKEGTNVDKVFGDLLEEVVRRQPDPNAKKKGKCVLL